MNDELLEVFCEEYTRHMNALRMPETGNRARDAAKLSKIVRHLDRLVDAIIDGVPAERVKDRMETLETQKAEIEARLAAAPQEDKPLLHPSMGARYRKAVSQLRESLDQNANGEAVEVLRSLIDRIVMHPAEDGPKDFVIDIEGDLAGILSCQSAFKTDPS